jgi:hypothetical protein
MDPLKTAVKYALIPLRIAVQIGDMFVGDDDEPKATRKPSQASPATPVPPQPKPKPRRARPQASQAPKPLGDTGIARKVETVIFRDPQERRRWARVPAR